MKKYIGWIGIFLGVALTAFTEVSTKNPKNGFEIKGDVNLPEKTLLVLSELGSGQLLAKDSAYVDKDGKFSFAAEGVAESKIYYITFNGANPPGVPLILENGASVKLSINKDAHTRFTVDGGKYNASMVKLHNLYTDFDKKMLDFNAEVAQYTEDNITDEIRQATLTKYNSLIKERSQSIEYFIRTEPSSPATYFAIMYLFQKPVPKLILLGSEKMNKELPNSSYSIQLKKDADRLGPTIPGAIAPDFSLLTPEGDSLSLTDLRGKVVLIDFWASWCGPCRKENPNVKRVYEKYKDKGFDILGVSLDNNATAWKAAIAKDGLTWYHVSDLKGWKSAASQLYSVRSIPQTFLLDREGRIIKANVHSGELDTILESLLGS